MAELWGDDSGRQPRRWLSNPGYCTLMDWVWGVVLALLFLGGFGLVLGLPFYDVWLRSQAGP